MFEPSKVLSISCTHMLRYTHKLGNVYCQALPCSVLLYLRWTPQHKHKDNKRWWNLSRFQFFSILALWPLQNILSIHSHRILWSHYFWSHSCSWPFHVGIQHECRHKAPTLFSTRRDSQQWQVELNFSSSWTVHALSLIWHFIGADCGVAVLTFCCIGIGLAFLFFLNLMVKHSVELKWICLESQQPVFCGSTMWLKQPAVRFCFRIQAGKTTTG